MFLLILLFFQQQSSPWVVVYLFLSVVAPMAICAGVFLLSVRPRVIYSYEPDKAYDWSLRHLEGRGFRPLPLCRYCPGQQLIRVEMSGSGSKNGTKHGSRISKKAYTCPSCNEFYHRGVLSALFGQVQKE